MKWIFISLLKENIIFTTIMNIEKKVEIRKKKRRFMRNNNTFLARHSKVMFNVNFFSAETQFINTPLLK